MSKTKKMIVSVICISVIAFAGIVLALFLGYFDHGRFEVVEAKWAGGRVAMLATRFENQALSGDESYVIIGDHLFSRRELRRAYYRQKELFSAQSNCLHLSWRDPHTLVVSCRDGSINRIQIGSQKHQAADVAVIYDNIPDVTRK